MSASSSADGGDNEKPPRETQSTAAHTDARYHEVRQELEKLRREAYTLNLIPIHVGVQTLESCVNAVVPPISGLSSLNALNAGAELDLATSKRISKEMVPAAMLANRMRELLGSLGNP